MTGFEPGRPGLRPPALSKRKSPIISDQAFVGMTGFEPATSCTPCKYATELRYIPCSFGLQM